MFERRTSGRLALSLLAALLACLAASVPASAACLPRPSACGYPDATNTGVPPGTTLTPSGSRTVTGNGTVLSGLEITGTVTVAADNVTIEDSRIVKTSGGSGSYAVILNSGAEGFTIRDSEISGPPSDTSGLESAVWNHYNNPGATASGVYFHGCADCWEGAGTFRDDYMVVDAAYSGSHDEDIYVCGTTVDVGHSTLINTHQQTATVFGDTICGGNDFTVTDSLLAGGGYVVYPQANSSSPVGTTRIAGNRFGRCQTSAVYNPGSGGTSCSGGGDTFGYYPLGGYYGLAAYTYSGPGHVWEDNVWDDSSQPVCDDGRPGCGSPHEPPEEEGEEAPEEEGEAPPEAVGPTGSSDAPSAVAALRAPTAPPPGAAGVRHAPLRALWRLPAAAGPGDLVRLTGNSSRGEAPLRCYWRIAVGRRVFRRHHGCNLRFRMPRAGTRYVTLIVRDGVGRRDSLRRRASGARLH